MRYVPTQLFLASLIAAGLVHLGTAPVVLAETTQDSTRSSDSPGNAKGQATDDAPTSDPDDASDSEDEQAQPQQQDDPGSQEDEDVPPAQDPERRRAQQMAQAGLMSGSSAFLVREWALDVSLQGGFGGTDEGSLILGRLMVGPMYITEPHALSLLGVADLQSYEGFSAGGAFQYLSLHTGLFAQVGSVVNLKAEPAFIGSLGWQIFAFEYQRRDVGGNESNVFMGKLHIPVTWLYRAFKPDNDSK